MLVGPLIYHTHIPSVYGAQHKARCLLHTPQNECVSVSKVCIVEEALTGFVVVFFQTNVILRLKNIPIYDIMTIAYVTTAVK